MSKSCLRCIGMAFLVVVLAGGAFVLVAGRWLAAPASSAMHADAIYVLGGDSGERVMLAADLYAKGMSPVLVVTGLDGAPVEARPAYLGWRGAMLATRSIPASAITYDEASSNSREEAAAAAKLAAAKGWKRILVVSDPPHLRRLQRVWGKAFAGSNVEVRLVPTRPRSWNEDAWWTDAKTTQFVLMELIKLVHNELGG